METGLTRITDEDREGENLKIKETVRDRTLGEVEKYIRKMGYVNTSKIAKELDVRWTTANDIIREVIDRLRSQSENAVVSQIAWYEDVLRQIEEEPEKFQLDPVEFIRFKGEMIDRINKLRDFLVGKSGELSNGANFAIWGSVNPKTIKAVQDTIRKQAEVIPDDTESVLSNPQ